MSHTRCQVLQNSITLNGLNWIAAGVVTPIKHRYSCIKHNTRLPNNPPPLLQFTAHQFAELRRGTADRQGAFSSHALAEVRSLVVCAPFGFICVEAGWIVTEVGRQPWIIYGVLRTEQAVTPMPGLQYTFIGFTLLYCFLGAVVSWLLYSQIVRTAPRAETPAGTE